MTAMFIGVIFLLQPWPILTAVVAGLFLPGLQRTSAPDLSRSWTLGTRWSCQKLKSHESGPIADPFHHCAGKCAGTWRPDMTVWTGCFFNYMLFHHLGWWPQWQRFLRKVNKYWNRPEEPTRGTSELGRRIWMMVGDFTLPEVVMDVLGEGDWVDEAPDPFDQPVMQSTYHFVSLCRYDPLCVIQFIESHASCAV